MNFLIDSIQIGLVSLVATYMAVQTYLLYSILQKLSVVKKPEPEGESGIIAPTDEDLWKEEQKRYEQ